MRVRITSTFALRVSLVLLLALAVLAAPQRRKKKEEDITQTLELPKDPPAAATAETQKLVFHVSPLSAKGLLSQQTRDALRALSRASSGAAIVKLRAFVAGSGDLRRVPSIVSETFTERKQPLPAVTVVQVGGLPLEGAQVVIESIAVSRKPVNPHGLAFVSGQADSSNQVVPKVAPLAEKSIANINTALKGVGLDATDVLRVTCLLSSLEDFAAVRNVVASGYPKAALNFVQLQRAPARSVVECEAVARLRQAAPEPLRFVNPPGLPASPNFSHVALVSAPKVILTGTQIAFGYQDSDARLAFQRLAKVVEQSGSSMHDVAMSSIYPLSNSLAEQVRRIRFEFYDKARPPASTMLPFEGLPGMEAGFAVDVVAVAK
ncbi:MAG: RidA family protein [Bryobacteraceae bacterium]